MFQNTYVFSHRYAINTQKLDSRRSTNLVHPPPILMQRPAVLKKQRQPLLDLTFYKRRRSRRPLVGDDALGPIPDLERENEMYFPIGGKMVKWGGQDCQ